MGVESLSPAVPRQRRVHSSRPPAQLRPARTHDTNTKPKPISRWGALRPTATSPTNLRQDA
eukprot:3199074-Pyramimonas_sp.AAC.1